MLHHHNTEKTTNKNLSDMDGLLARELEIFVCGMDVVVVPSGYK